MEKERKILLLGSGLMAEAVVIYLSKRAENHITIASNILPDAEKIAKAYPRCTAGSVDVQNAEQLGDYVKKADVVISYVPAFLHTFVANVCLKEKRNMITSSYISADLEKLAPQVKEAGLIFLNECGLDPGIDHLATMQAIEHAKKEGAKIVAYESWCGGLPSPECCDNPLGYKFSWSPVGALSALNNNAQYLEDGKEVTIPKEDLLYKTFDRQVNMSLNLEGYANRDSLRYLKLYGLNDAHSCIRGTLRYKGFSELMRGLIELGILRKEPCTVKEEGLNAVLASCLTEELPNKHKLTAEGLQSVWEEYDIPSAEVPLALKALIKVANNKHYDHYSPAHIHSLCRHIVQLLKFLDLLNDKIKIKNEGKTYLEVICEHLTNKLKYEEGEADAVYMQHIFKMVYPNGRKRTLKSTLIALGKEHRSAMSKLVGTPTAVATQLVLDGVIKTPGVHMPDIKEIWQPMLENLHKEGIKLREEWE